MVSDIIGTLVISDGAIGWARSRSAARESAGPDRIARVRQILERALRELDDDDRA
jgi:hypothetical protein